MQQRYPYTSLNMKKAIFAILYDQSDNIRPYTL